MSDDTERIARESLAAAFRGRLLVDDDAVAPMLVDWRGRYRGRALAVAMPEDTEAVAAVVRWCRDNGYAVVPQGGNTGLSGAATPDDGPRNVVLSLARMKRVRSIDTAGNTITVEAGCTLGELHAAAEAADRLFPLSLPSEGSCTIGGNLSTNAGGTGALAYGVAREMALGVEVVLADGRVLNALSKLKKDNTGYDLRNLFIGAEGTLGVITAATLKLFPRPAAQLTALAAVADVMAATRLLELAQRRLASTLTAFELMSAFCLELVERVYPHCPNPLAGAGEYFVLLECSDAEGEAHATALFEGLLAEAIDAGLVADAVVADSIARSKALWALRENISEAQATIGKNIKHDISVPISSIARFIDSTNAQLLRRFPDIRMVVFGHLGDGNLHYNVSPATDYADAAAQEAFLARQPEINRITHDAVAAFDGSISAEHGLGVLRRDEAARYKSPVEIALMWRIKQALDPGGIMNPGKVLAPPPAAS